MKKFYSMIMIFAMMVAAVGFVACGGDDDDEVLGGGGNSSTSATSSSGKRLVKIIEERTNTSSKADILYDKQGRVEKVVVYNDIKANGKLTSKSFYYDIDGFIITDGSKIIEYIIKDGKVIKASSGEKASYFTYNNGYLKSMESTAIGFVDEIKYYWSDGNIEKAEYYENEHLVKVNTYEYTNYDSFWLGDPVIWMAYLPIPFTHNLVWPSYSLWLGNSSLFGKSSKKLLAKSIEENGRQSFVYTYNWTMNDGLPIMLKVTVHGSNILKEGVEYIISFEWE